MSFYVLNEIKKRFPEGDLFRKNLKQGGVLFQQGDSVAAIYFVERGEIVGERALASGHSLTVVRVRENEAVGEESFFFPERFYTAIASQPSTIVGIDRNSMLDAMRRSPEFAANVNHCLTERYLDCMMHREFLQIRSAEERILCWLIWLQEKHPGELELKGRMGGIGTELGLTKESVYRALAKLENDGKITRNEGAIALTREGSTHSC